MDIHNHKFVTDLLGSEAKLVRRVAMIEARRTKLQAIRDAHTVDEILDDLEAERLAEVEVRPRFYGSSSASIVATRLS